MKASAFATVIGGALLVLAPVGVVAPAAYLKGMQAVVTQTPLVYPLAVAGAVISLLVLIQPARGRSRLELMMRVLAWLGLIKSVALLWFPGFPDMAMEWATTLPGWAMRLGNVCDLAFGLFMLWTARRLIEIDSSSTGESTE